MPTAPYFSFSTAHCVKPPSSKLIPTGVTPTPIARPHNILFAVPANAPLTTGMCSSGVTRSPSILVLVNCMAPNRVSTIAPPPCTNITGRVAINALISVNNCAAIAGFSNNAPPTLITTGVLLVAMNQSLCSRQAKRQVGTLHGL